MGDYRWDSSKIRARVFQIRVVHESSLWRFQMVEKENVNLYENVQKMASIAIW